MGKGISTAVGVASAAAAGWLQMSGYQNVLLQWTLAFIAIAFLLYAAIAWIGGYMGWREHLRGRRELERRRVQRDPMATPVPAVHIKDSEGTLLQNLSVRNFDQVAKVENSIQTTFDNVKGTRDTPSDDQSK
jgi:hypothetical protein